MKFESTFPVGKYSCRMMIEAEARQVTLIASEWSPHMPPPGSFSKAEMAQYRAGRHALLLQVAEELGGNVLVIE